MGLLIPQNTILHLQGAVNFHLTEKEARELSGVMAALGTTDFSNLIMIALPILQEYLETHPDFDPTVFDPKMPQSDFVAKHLTRLYHAERKSMR
ncbi:MAG: hypothetical protein HYT41_01340 [Candidatus Sungbacteria bacterium]|nr:hypothetical protein [Candidatus Sungbacteria bacterium]